MSCLASPLQVSLHAQNRLLRGLDDSDADIYTFHQLSYNPTGYHTPSQVVVGTFIGTLTSTLWFLLYPSFHSAPIPDLLAYGPGARDVRVWGIQSWEGRLEGLIGWAYGLIGR